MVSWAEDIAEYITLYHITEEMNFSYKIILTETKKTADDSKTIEIFSFKPTENKELMNRKKHLKDF